MDIRLAYREDLPVINEIYNQAVSQRFCTAHLSPVSLKKCEAWFATHDPDRFPVFVAVSGEQVSGWVSLGPYRSDRQALAHVAEVSYYVDEKEKSIGGKSFRGVRAFEEFCLKHPAFVKQIMDEQVDNLGKVKSIVKGVKEKLHA